MYNIKATKFVCNKVKKIKCNTLTEPHTHTTRTHDVKKAHW